MMLPVSPGTITWMYSTSRKTMRPSSALFASSRQAFVKKRTERRSSPRVSFVKRSYSPSKVLLVTSINPVSIVSLHQLGTHATERAAARLLSAALSSPWSCAKLIGHHGLAQERRAFVRLVELASD